MVRFSALHTGIFRRNNRKDTSLQVDACIVEHLNYIARYILFAKTNQVSAEPF